MNASTKQVIAGVVAALSAATAFADYKQAVQADAPIAYQRFNDPTARVNINANSGSLGAAGNATNLNVRTYTSAIAGSQKRGQFFDYTARSIVPFQSAINPDNTQPFTVEFWAQPSSDQINGGQAIINNRYAYSGVNRQGWVVFQRAPNDTYSNKGGFEGVGWNFRMYRGSGGNSGLDVVSGVPYNLGEWTHVVVVYDPVTANDSSLNMYINGVLAKTATWNSDNPGYVANTDDHGGEAVNGPAGLAFGAYNNTAVSGGQTSQSNPYFGGISDFALYAKKLSEETILAHYQNGTNTGRTKAYETLVQEDSPVEFLTFGDMPPDTGTLINQGELRSAGNVTVNNKVQLDAPASQAGDWSDHSIASHRRAGGGTRANIPFLAQNNPSEDKPFSVELWVRPQLDRVNPGAAVMNNRKVGATRSGWVIFQRAPNSTYNGQSGFEGVGYNFRMYNGVNGSTAANITTRVPYSVNEWQHLVFTWAPDFDTGNGNWSGVLTAYVNGTPIVPDEDPNTPNQVTGIYHANTDPPLDGTPADLAIGSYNANSGWGQEFDGDVDEVAIYPNWLLTADQVAAHYEAGTNSHPATNYSALVLSAPYNGTFDLGNPTAQGMGPSTYLRFNDPAPFPAKNSGTGGWNADGTLQSTVNNVPGPTGAGYPGFEASNTATPFDGATSWVSLNAPSVLDFSNALSLEAWIRPNGDQVEDAGIITHGPTLLSLYSPDAVAELGAPSTSSAVYMKIDNGSANYTVGASDGLTEYYVTASIPAGDLTDGKWVHLVGTYDGTTWKIYRNGALLNSTAAHIDSLLVPGGDWAIGSAGEGWENLFKGDIDETAIYNKALTPEQIQAHYTSATTTAATVTVKVVSYTATTITLGWTGATGKILIQKKSDIGSPTWTNYKTTTASTITLPKDASNTFFRIQSDYTGPDIP